MREEQTVDPVGGGGGEGHSVYPVCGRGFACEPSRGCDRTQADQVWALRRGEVMTPKMRSCDPSGVWLYLLIEVRHGLPN